MLADCCDKELLDGLKHNDISAFNAIYKHFSRPLYVFLLQKLKDHEVCNDILQDIFTTLWEKRVALKIETSLKAYLYQSARHKIIDIYRSDSQYQKYISRLADLLVTDHSAIIDRIDQKNKLKEVELAVNKLPARMKEIFILSRFEHRTITDIADKTKLSPQTVKNQISKALRILRLSYLSADLLLLFISLFFSK